MKSSFQINFDELMTTLITEKDKYKSLETEIEKQDALKRIALLENRLNTHIAEMNNRLIVLENKVNTTNHKNDEIFIYDDRKSIEQNLLEAERFFSYRDIKYCLFMFDNQNIYNSYIQMRITVLLLIIIPVLYSLLSLFVNDGHLFFLFLCITVSCILLILCNLTESQLTRQTDFSIWLKSLFFKKFKKKMNNQEDFNYRGDYKSKNLLKAMIKKSLGLSITQSDFVTTDIHTFMKENKIHLKPKLKIVLE